MVNSGHDISTYITTPVADSDGYIDIGQATLDEVKVFAETTEGDNEANVKAVLDTAMDDMKGSATVKSAKPGLYYSMEASNDIAFPNDEEKTKSGGATMATDTTVNVNKPAEKPSGNSVFYRIKVSLSND